MKRRSAWSVGVVAILLAAATWAYAASMNDIAGTWGVYSKAAGKVSGLGADHSEGFGAIEFTAYPPGSNAGLFSYHDPGGYTYTGNFTLAGDGKVLTMQFDPNGRQEFEDMMRDWLQRSAAELGVSFRNITFAYDLNGILLSPVKTSKKTNGPVKGKVSAKGIVHADIYQGNIYIGSDSGKLSFKSTTKFLSKQ
jgi:hypothetical protein